MMDKLSAMSDLPTRYGSLVQWVETWAIEEENFSPVRLRVDNGNMSLYVLKEIMVYE